jgi:hypothetical protein
VIGDHLGDVEGTIQAHRLESLPDMLSDGSDGWDAVGELL